MDNTIHRFKNARIAMFVGDHPPVRLLALVAANEQTSNICLLFMDSI